MDSDEEDDGDSAEFENKNGDVDNASIGADSDQEGSADESDAEENDVSHDEEKEEDHGTKVQ